MASMELRAGVRRLQEGMEHLKSDLRWPRPALSIQSMSGTELAIYLDMLDMGGEWEARLKARVRTCKGTSGRVSRFTRTATHETTIKVHPTVRPTRESLKMAVQSTEFAMRLDTDPLFRTITNTISLIVLSAAHGRGRSQVVRGGWRNE